MSHQTPIRRFLRNSISWLSSHDKLVALFLVVGCMTTAESILIERKYGLFTAGFLQAHPITDTSDRLLFFVFSLWMDFLVCGVVGLLWFGLLSRLRIHSYWVSYHFFILVGGIGLLFAGVKYQLLNYFSDTVTFTLLHKLGGDLATMRSYASEEKTMIGVCALALLSLYLMGAFLIGRLRKHLGVVSQASPSRRKWMAWVCFGIVSLAATAMIYRYVRQSDKLNYGLKEKISYFCIDRLFARFMHQAEDDWVKPPSLAESLNFADGDVVLAPPVGSKPKHMVLVLLEGARGDLLEKKVGERFVAPNLRKLAQNGTAIQQAYCHVGFTRAARNAMLTGSFGKIRKDRSVFSRLRQIGYEVSAFSGWDETRRGGSLSLGMEENCKVFFDAYQAVDDRISISAAPGSLALDDAFVTRVVLSRLPNMDWEKPQFIYVKFNSGHYPYSFPQMPLLLGGTAIPRNKIKPENREWLESTYWNAQAYADEMCGRLFQALRDQKIMDQTVIVVVSDHGEALYENGTLGHGHALNDVQTRVPLIINVPGVQVEEPFGHIEIMKLMFQYAGISPEPPPRITSPYPKAVFQIVGSVLDPIQIGMVEADGRRTTLDMRTREVKFSEMGKWLPYKNLNVEPEFEKRTERLVAEWRRLQSLEAVD